VYFDTSGQETARDTIVQTIGKDTLINSETWYFMSPVWLTNRDDGVWYNDIPINEGILYKYPAQVGDTFTCDICMFYQVVAATDTTVRHDFGLFYCYAYLTVYDWGDSSFSYVAPGVGFIEGRSLYQKNDSAFYVGITTKLIDYHLE
jgi:hypothetical protein